MYFDIGIVAVLALGAVIGLAKGFFKPFNRLLATLIAFAIIYFTLDMVKEYVFGVQAVSGIVNGLMATLMQKLAPEGLKDAVVGADLTDILNSSFFKLLIPSINAAGAEHGTLPIDAFGTIMAQTTFTILLALVMLGVLRLVLIIFTMILDAFSKDRDITGLSRLLGFVIGTVRGAVFAFVIIVIACPFMTFIPADVTEDYEKNSVVAKPAITFIHENVAKFLNFDAMLNVTPADTDDDDDDDDTNTEPTAEERLAAKQAEVATAKSTVIADLQAIYNYDIYVQLNGSNIDAYKGYAEFVKAGGDFVNFINALEADTEENCTATLDKLGIISLQLEADKSIGVILADITKEDADTEIDNLLTAITTTFGNFLDGDTTVTVPADATAWEALATGSTIAAPTASAELVALRDDVDELKGEILAIVQAWSDDTLALTEANDVAAYTAFKAFVADDGALDNKLDAEFVTADKNTFAVTELKTRLTDFKEALEAETSVTDSTLDDLFTALKTEIEGSGAGATAFLTSFLDEFSTIINTEFTSLAPANYGAWAGTTP